MADSRRRRSRERSKRRSRRASSGSPPARYSRDKHNNTITDRPTPTMTAHHRTATTSRAPDIPSSSYYTNRPDETSRMPRYRSRAASGSSSSDGSTSSSLLDISRRYPDGRHRGNAFTRFFTAPSERRVKRQRSGKKKKQRSRVLYFANSSSSSVNSDLAYGNGYIPRRTRDSPPGPYDAPTAVAPAASKMDYAGPTAATAAAAATTAAAAAAAAGVTTGHAGASMAAGHRPTAHGQSHSYSHDTPSQEPQMYSQPPPPSAPSQSNSNSLGVIAGTAAAAGIAGGLAAEYYNSDVQFPSKPPTPRRRKTDDEIMAIGQQLSDMAQQQNDMDLKNSGKTRPSGLVSAATKIDAFRNSRKSNGPGGRGLGLSKPTNASSDDDNDSEWESADESDDFSDGSADSEMAYGTVVSQAIRPTVAGAAAAGAAAGAANFASRKNTVVDPRLFGEMNSLRGIVNTPCGFGDGKGAPPPRQSGPRPLTRSATEPVHNAYPSSAPGRDRLDAAGHPLPRRSRPEPVPLQQPVPQKTVSPRLYDAEKLEEVSRRELKHSRERSDDQPSAWGGAATAAGVGIAAAGAVALAKDRKSDRRASLDQVEEEARRRDKRSQRDDRRDVGADTIAKRYSLPSKYAFDEKYDQGPRRPFRFRPSESKTVPASSGKSAQEYGSRDKPQEPENRDNLGALPVSAPPRPLTPTVVTVDREPTFEDDESVHSILDGRLSRRDSFELSNSPTDGQKKEAPAEERLQDGSTIGKVGAVGAAVMAGAIVANTGRSDDERRDRDDYREEDSRNPSRKSTASSSVQDEADRYYRESEAARKIAAEEIRSRSKADDDDDSSVIDKWSRKDTTSGPVRVVTPPEYHHHDAGRYDAPNADVMIDNKFTPREADKFLGSGDGRDRSAPYMSRDPDCERDRPLLNLVCPTPALSRQHTPAPEEQKERSRGEGQGADSEETTQPEVPVVSDRSRDADYDDGTFDTAPAPEPRDENQSPDRNGSETSDKSKPLLDKTSQWGIIASAIAGSSKEPSSEPEGMVTESPKEIQDGEFSRDMPATREQIYHVDDDNDVPPIPGPKPTSPKRDQMPGGFADDIEFAATLAAGLKDTGFDPNMVIDDPKYRRRDSPPGSDDDLNGNGSRVVSEITSHGKDGEAEAAEPADEWADAPVKLSKKEKKRLEKLKKQQEAEAAQDTTSRDLPVEEAPEPEIEPPVKLSKKEQRKRDKAAKAQALASQDDMFADPEPAVDQDRTETSRDLDDTLADVPASASRDVEVDEEWDAPKSKKSKKKSKRKNGTVDSYDDDGPPSRSRDPFEDRDVTSVVSDSRYDERRSGNGYDEEVDSKSVVSAPDGRKGDAEKKSGGMFSGIFGSSGNGDGKKSFLDNAGTLGAGVGLAGAGVAAASMLSRPNATDEERDISGEKDSSRETEEHVRRSDDWDPDVIARAIKPAIDPQYGDLLPLPPSEPGSPATAAEDLELPSLPDSRPDTPPDEQAMRRDLLSHSRRRSTHDTPMKSHSNTAIPIQLRLGQRSGPSSPAGFFKSSPTSSPTVGGPESPSTAARRPSRPTSWDTSREIKPLYLLEHARQGSLEETIKQEDLPALPPSEASSRSSPGPGSDAWESADEYALGERDLDETTRPALSLDTNMPLDTPTVDHIGSQDTTPKAEIKPQFPDIYAAPGADTPQPSSQEWTQEQEPDPVDSMSKDRSSYLLRSAPSSNKSDRTVRSDDVEQTRGDDDLTTTPSKSTGREGLGLGLSFGGLAGIDEGMASADEHFSDAIEGQEYPSLESHRVDDVQPEMRDVHETSEIATRDAMDLDEPRTESIEEAPAASAEEPPAEEFTMLTGKAKKKAKKAAKKRQTLELDPSPSTASTSQAAEEAPVDTLSSQGPDEPETTAVTEEPVEQLTAPEPAPEFVEAPKKGKKNKKNKKQALAWEEDLGESPTPTQESAPAGPVEPEPSDEVPVQPEPVSDALGETAALQDRSLEIAEPESAEPASTSEPVIEAQAPAEAEQGLLPASDPIDTWETTDKKSKKKKKKAMQSIAWDDEPAPSDSPAQPTSTSDEAVAGEPGASMAAEPESSPEALAQSQEPTVEPSAEDEWSSPALSKKDKKKKKKALQSMSWEDEPAPSDSSAQPTATTDEGVTREPETSLAAEPEAVPDAPAPAVEPSADDEWSSPALSKKDKKKKKKAMQQMSWDDEPAPSDSFTQQEIGTVDEGVPGEPEPSLAVEPEAKPVAEPEVMPDAPAPSQEPAVEPSAEDEWSSPALSKKDKKKKKAMQQMSWEDEPTPSDSSTQQPASIVDEGASGEPEPPLATEPDAPAPSREPAVEPTVEDEWSSPSLSKKDKKKKKKALQSMSLEDEPASPDSFAQQPSGTVDEGVSGEPEPPLATEPDAPAPSREPAVEPTAEDEWSSPSLSKKDKKKKKKALQSISLEDEPASYDSFSQQPSGTVDEAVSREPEPEAVPDAPPPAVEPSAEDEWSSPALSKKDKKKKKKDRKKSLQLDSLDDSSSPSGAEEARADGKTEDTARDSTLDTVGEVATVAAAASAGAVVASSWDKTVSSDDNAVGDAAGEATKDNEGERSLQEQPSEPLFSQDDRSFDTSQEPATSVEPSQLPEQDAVEQTKDELAEPVPMADDLDWSAQAEVEAPPETTELQSDTLAGVIAEESRNAPESAQEEYEHAAVEPPEAQPDDEWDRPLTKKEKKKRAKQQQQQQQWEEEQTEPAQEDQPGGWDLPDDFFSKPETATEVSDDLGWDRPVEAVKQADDLDNWDKPVESAKDIDALDDWDTPAEASKDADVLDDWDKPVESVKGPDETLDTETHRPAETDAIPETQEAQAEDEWSVPVNSKKSKKAKKRQERLSMEKALELVQEPPSDSGQGPESELDSDAQAESSHNAPTEETSDPSRSAEQSEQESDKPESGESIDDSDFQFSTLSKKEKKKLKKKQAAMAASEDSPMLETIPETDIPEIQEPEMEGTTREPGFDDEGGVDPSPENTSGFVTPAESLSGQDPGANPEDEWGGFSLKKSRKDKRKKKAKDTESEQEQEPEKTTPQPEPDSEPRDITDEASKPSESTALDTSEGISAESQPIEQPQEPIEDEWSVGLSKKEKKKKRKSKTVSFDLGDSTSPVQDQDKPTDVAEPEASGDAQSSPPEVAESTAISQASEDFTKPDDDDVPVEARSFEDRPMQDDSPADTSAQALTEESTPSAAEADSEDLWSAPLSKKEKKKKAKAQAASHAAMSAEERMEDDQVAPATEPAPVADISENLPETTPAAPHSDETAEEQQPIEHSTPAEIEEPPQSEVKEEDDSSWSFGLSKKEKKKKKKAKALALDDWEPAPEPDKPRELSEQLDIANEAETAVLASEPQIVSEAVTEPQPETQPQPEDEPSSSATPIEIIEPKEEDDSWSQGLSKKEKKKRKKAKALSMDWDTAPESTDIKTESPAEPSPDVNIESPAGDAAEVDAESPAEPSIETAAEPSPEPLTVETAVNPDDDSWSQGLSKKEKKKRQKARALSMAWEPTSEPAELAAAPPVEASTEQASAEPTAELSTEPVNETAADSSKDLESWDSHKPIDRPDSGLPKEMGPEPAEIPSSVEANPAILPDPMLTSTDQTELNPDIQGAELAEKPSEDMEPPAETAALEPATEVVEDNDDWTAGLSKKEKKKKKKQKALSVDWESTPEPAVEVAQSEDLPEPNRPDELDPQPQSQDSGSDGFALAGLSKKEKKKMKKKKALELGLTDTEEQAQPVDTTTADEAMAATEAGISDEISPYGDEPAHFVSDDPGQLRDIPMPGEQVTSEEPEPLLDPEQPQLATPSAEPEDAWDFPVTKKSKKDKKRKSLPLADPAVQTEGAEASRDASSTDTPKEATEDDWLGGFTTSKSKKKNAKAQKATLRASMADSADDTGRGEAATAKQETVEIAGDEASRSITFAHKAPATGSAEVTESRDEPESSFTGAAAAAAAGAGVAAAAALSTRSPGGKKGKKGKKKKIVDKRQSQDDDLFDSPALWESADKKNLEDNTDTNVDSSIWAEGETTKAQLAERDNDRFWGGGDEDEVEDQERQTPGEEDIGARSLETGDDTTMAEKAQGLEAADEAAAATETQGVVPDDVDKIATSWDEPQDESTEAYRGKETWSFPKSESFSESDGGWMETSRQGVPLDDEAEQEPVSSRGIVNAPRTGPFGLLQRGGTDLEDPVGGLLREDSQASALSGGLGSDYGGTRLSPARSLPAVPEVPEAETEMPAARELPQSQEVNRDSGFAMDSPSPLQRRSHLQERDSGVHTDDWDEPAARGPETPDRHDRHDRHMAAALGRSPHSTPVLREPAAPELTPEPEKRRNRSTTKTTSEETREPSSLKHSTTASTSTSGSRSRDYGSLGLDGPLAAGAVGAAGAAAAASGRRSVSDNSYDVRPAHNSGDGQRQQPLLSSASPSQPHAQPQEPRLRRSVSNTSLARKHTPEPLRFRPDSPGSKLSRTSQVEGMRSTPTPPLRRVDKRVSGDLRALRQENNSTPTANEGRVRSKDMADVYDGFGEGRIGSPRSPTRPHSMRRRQSMQVLELESRVEQLLAENRLLSDARTHAEQTLSQRSAGALTDRDAEIDTLKRSLAHLQSEVARLTEVNEGLTSANAELANNDNGRYGVAVARGLDGGPVGGSDALEQSIQEKDAEIADLRAQLEDAKEQVREMQRQILASKAGDADFLNIQDEDYFDSRCQQLCSHVQQWVLRFSKFSDMRACRLTSEINDEKLIDRLDNAVLDGTDVDRYLSDRVRRRDIFMSMTMNMIWEFIFTRYLFGMDREQRQKLKSLEKMLTDVGPPQAVRQWRAVTLTLLARRDSFRAQKEQDTEAVVQAIFQTLCKILPPPGNKEAQIESQLRRVLLEAVELSVEMRTQKAEYMMLPPLQPEYDSEGELAATVQFNASMMNERSGKAGATNEELDAEGAVVRIVLFPLVVKKGDDAGVGDDEIVVCPAQVIVAGEKSRRSMAASSDAGGASLGAPSHLSVVTEHMTGQD